MKKVIFALLIVLIVLVGCSDNEEEQESTNGSTDEINEDNEAQQEESYKNIYPLTGIKTNEPVNNRIVSVMVNNHTKARPQTGLNQADIVFEILAEGTITRFLALFQSELPEVIGPVRSAREYYFDLANDYNALYVYHGAAEFVNDMVINRGTDYLNGSQYDNDGRLFKRESFRKAPHNSYLQADAVYEVAEEKGYEITADYDTLPFLSEDEIDSLAGEEAQTIEIQYSASYPSHNVQYEYQQETDSYIRLSAGEQTIDLETEAPIEVENILIMETPHQVIDEAGRRAIDMTSGGNAYLLQNGIVQHVQWKNDNGRIIPVKDGQVVGLVPGQTWINVIPTSPGIDHSVTFSNL